MGDVEEAHQNAILERFGVDVQGLYVLHVGVEMGGGYMPRVSIEGVPMSQNISGPNNRTSRYTAADIADVQAGVSSLERIAREANRKLVLQHAIKEALVEDADDDYNVDDGGFDPKGGGLGQ